jgi:hypothetical protein
LTTRLIQTSWSRELIADGETLDLVLYPGTGAVRTEISFARLQPHRRYSIDGLDNVLTADAAGTARVTVDVSGRLRLFLRPEH